MSRAVSLCLIAVVILTLTACGDGEDAIADQVAGDDETTFVDAEIVALPDAAEGFLATDRPWRAARAMRRYVDEVDSVRADARFLAARAEAGWGAWDEVLTLLSDEATLRLSEDGIGYYLLGRAQDEAGDASAAIGSYRTFLSASPPSGELQLERTAARLRLGLALLRIGEREESDRQLSVVADEAPGAATWFDVLRADALARAGDFEGATAVVEGLDSGYRGLRSWRARIEAAWNSGDPASARYLANQARSWASTNSTRAEMAVRAGRAAVLMDDVQDGRTAFRSAIALDAAGPWGRAAAAELGDGERTPEEHLSVARVYRAQGFHQESIEGFEVWLDQGEGTTAEKEGVRLEYANALFYAERYDDVPRALQPIANLTSARMLQARAAGRAGDTDAAVGIYLDVERQFQGAANGAQALLLAADIRQEAGDEDGAIRLFDRLIRAYPGTSQMGLGMMRRAGVAFHQKDYESAASIWDDYQRRYPRGTNALQAMYWSGKAHLAMGDSTEAERLFLEIRRQDRDSYYSVLASRQLGIPFWPVPLSPDPGDDPTAASRVRAWMQGINILLEAGFPVEAAAEVDRIVGIAGSHRATRYALAEALADRGFSRHAIRIGLSLQVSGAPNQRLLRILYPFPYRTLIIEEAHDRGLDPFMVAALIRQESMFEVRITSHVGARGLMQIMPLTGTRLADAVGIQPWETEMLYHPEINVHLGTRYLAQHWERFDEALPSVFSAYNAGAHRVEWWSAFPEYGDDELFTERIPFRETRDYVKILTRNYAIYAGLYGSEAAALVSRAP